MGCRRSCTSCKYALLGQYLSRVPYSRASAAGAAQVWLTPTTASLLGVLTALTGLRAVRLEAYAINDIRCCAPASL